jgi:hypothetical protein
MTNGRVTIAAGGAASLAAVAATFGLANLVGHQFGFDLWPMPGSEPTREIEVPALSPSRPGVNPLLPASNALSSSVLSRNGGGRAAGFAPVPIGFPGATVPGLTVTSGPAGSLLPGIPPVGGGANARRNGGGGSVGTRPLTSNPASIPSTPAVTPTPSAPTASPVVNAPAAVVPGRESNGGDNGNSTSSSTGNSAASGQRKKTTTSTSSNTSTTTPSTEGRKSTGRAGSPPGQAKTQQTQTQTSTSPTARNTAPAPAEEQAPPQPAAPSSDGQTSSGSNSSGDGRTPSAPPGQQGKG